MVHGTYLLVAAYTLTSATHLVIGLSLDSAVSATHGHVQRSNNNELAYSWAQVGGDNEACGCGPGELYNREYFGTDGSTGSGITLAAAQTACEQVISCTGITWASHGYDQIMGSGVTVAQSGGLYTDGCGPGPPTSTVSFGGYQCWVRNDVTTTTTMTTTTAMDPSATGDPHLQNVLGQRFDLMKPGKQVLISIPRLASAESALLRVEAEAIRLGGSCADMYFHSINVTGRWAEASHAGGYYYDSQRRVEESPEWLSVGKVKVKISHGRTQNGNQYLNFYVKHLGRAGFAVGGLLGEDDHQDVATPPAECKKTIALRALEHANSSSTASVAVASSA